MPARFLAIAMFLVCLLPSGWLAWRFREAGAIGYLDDGIYYATARALAAGEGYRIESLPERPLQTKYPPLYALYLSAVWRLDPRFPDNLPVAALAAWLPIPLLLALAWRIFRDLRLPAGALTSLMAVNVCLLLFGAALMPEALCTVLLLASMLLMERHPFASGVAGAAAFLTKAAALPLALSGPLFLLLRRRRRDAALFAAGMWPLAAAWTLWAATHARGGEDAYYTSYAAFQLQNVSPDILPRLLWMNADALLRGAGDLLAYGRTLSLPDRFFALLIAVAAASGAVRLARTQGARPLHYFAAGYIPMLLVWHYPPNERFLFPLLPLGIAGIAAETSHVWTLIRSCAARQRTAAVAAGAAWALLLGAGLWRNAYAACRTLPQTLQMRSDVAAAMRPVYRWIAANTPGDAAFLAWNDPMLYLAAGRRGRRIQPMPRCLYLNDRVCFVQPFEDAPSFMLRRGLDYALTTPSDYSGDLSREEAAAIAARLRNAPELELLFEAAGAVVYRLRRCGKQGPTGRVNYNGNNSAPRGSGEMADAADLKSAGPQGP